MHYFFYSLDHDNEYSADNIHQLVLDLNGVGNQKEIEEVCPLISVLVDLKITERPPHSKKKKERKQQVINVCFILSL